MILPWKDWSHIQPRVHFRSERASLHFLVLNKQYMGFNLSTEHQLHTDTDCIRRIYSTVLNHSMSLKFFICEPQCLVFAYKNGSPPSNNKHHNVKTFQVADIPLLNGIMG